MDFAPPRGMRDFYPEDMVLRNRIFDAWRAAAVAHGFEHYDACVVESLELLKRKAGEEVENQVYAFQDKSGRDIALRAEMTPTLARMVAQRQGSLQFPLKWFCIAQCFRYERMTKGRKREHYQLNLDVIGEEDVSGEAEVLAAAIDAMRRMGVPDEAYRVRLSSRALLSELLARLGIDERFHAGAFLALDKKGKMPREAIEEIMRGEGLDDEACRKAFDLMDIASLDQAAAIAGADSPAIARIRELFSLLEIYGVRDQVVFDVSVVRGLAYYTGIVFEAFDHARRRARLRRRRRRRAPEVPRPRGLRRAPGPGLHRLSAARAARRRDAPRRAPARRGPRRRPAPPRAEGQGVLRARRRARHARRLPRAGRPRPRNRPPEGPRHARGDRDPARLNRPAPFP